MTEFEVAVTVPASGCPDGDYTDDMLAMKTRFVPQIPGFDPVEIPVSSARVVDGILIIVGYVRYDGEVPDERTDDNG